MKNFALILASGSGSRMGLDIPKQFYQFNGKTVLEYSVLAFQKHKDIDEILVVSNPDFMDLTKKILNNNFYSKVSKIIAGGKTRQESSRIGVNEILDNNANVLIHDAVRPFVSEEIITACITALKKYEAVNTAIEVSDTIFSISDSGFTDTILNRNKLRRCQTPQCFKVSLIKKAHKLASEINFNSATDDCSLILKFNLAEIFNIKGSENNIKITYPSDLNIAGEILNSI